MEVKIIKSKKSSFKNDEKNIQKQKTVSSVNSQSCLKMYDYMVL